MMNKILSKLLFTVLAVLLTVEVMAQVPQGFNFQAVARDANGDLIANADLAVQISILQGAEDGTTVYTETQNPSTNETGLFDLVIGEGTSEDDFSAIDWSSDDYYAKLEIDPEGGTEYEELGITRLLSVPYALLAQDVVNGSSNGSELSLPLNLDGPNNNMSVTLGTDEGDNNYGFVGLGNADGDTLARLLTHSLNDTTSRGRLMVEDTYGRLSDVIPGEFTTGHKDGGLRAHLTSNNLFVINWDIEGFNRPAWFGTNQGDGFYQMVDYTDTGDIGGAILSGFWPGFPTLLLEDENEFGLIELRAEKQTERNIGVITLRDTDGSELSITSEGINNNTNINGNLHVDGDITHTGTSSQTSDRNLKENIQPLQNGLNTIMKLNPSTYNFRGNGLYKGLKLSTGLKYGLIAQEVEEVLPSLVQNNRHTYSEVASSGSGPDAASESEITKTMEYKTLNYTELVPVLVKAVQEQQQEIEQLREEVEQLKEERKAIEQLQKDVKELKKKK